MDLGRRQGDHVRRDVHRRFRRGAADDYNIVLLLRAPRGFTEYPVAEEAESADEARVPAVFERWGVWLGVLAALILIAYTAPVIEMLNTGVPGSPPFRTW